MRLTADFHTHTVYSHGKGTIYDNAVSASEKGLTAVGITDHGFSHKFLCMHKRDMKPMREECDLATEKTGVKTLLGVESNIIGIDGIIDLKACLDLLKKSGYNGYSSLEICHKEPHEYGINTATLRLNEIYSKI